MGCNRRTLRECSNGVSELRLWISLTIVQAVNGRITPPPWGLSLVLDPSVLDEILSQEHKIDGKVVDVKRAVPKSEAPGPSSRYYCFAYGGQDLGKSKTML